MEIALISIMYFGALLVPLGYFLVRGRSGKLSRIMFRGAAMQLILSACVYALVWYTLKAGHAEWCVTKIYYLPVNAFSLLYFCTTPFPAFRRRERPSQTIEVDRSRSAIEKPNR